ncbi:hypothetical protein GT031_28020 [Streptomyces sp. SID2888]|nr:hypothetical protein [Streptomyces sp. SID2888]
MVGTMAMLRVFIRRARMSRHPLHLPAGLPADDEVLLDAPDEPLAPALVAAGRGDHGPASALLAATRKAADWEDRDRYVTRLAAFARARHEWLAHWCAAAPDDPDALLVRAELALLHAWESPARAELLHRAAPLIAAATGGDPHDPVPWRVALDQARGTGAGHRVFERLWGEAVRRSPHHYGCHVAALHYLSSAWHGSHRECFDFAETAAQDTPHGSLMQALPLRAAFAYLTDGGGAVVGRDRLDAAADRAIALSSRHPAADPRPAEVRNLLAYVLAALERREDALTQLRLIGPYVTSFPWDRAGDDPLGGFLELRDRIGREVTSAWRLPPTGPPRPRFERTGRMRSGGY